MQNDSYFSVVKKIAHTIHDKNAYFETAKNIADWWMFRSNLIAGKKIEPSHINTYKPVVLSVDEKGILSSRRYTTLKTIAKSK
jgi:hypothetical protein